MASVRPGTAADRRRLRAIQSAALAEPWPRLLDLAGDDGPLLRVVEAGDDGAVDGVECDGRVVGYGVALTADAPLAYLAELAIDPAFQGRGFGTALLTDLLAVLGQRGIERVRLTARESDSRVRAFYASYGFETVDLVPDHFERDDGVVLERRLDDDTERRDDTPS